MDRYRQLDRDLAQKPYPAAGQDGLPAGAFQLASPAAGRGRLPAGAFQLVSPAAGWGRLPAGAFQLASRGAKGCLGGQRETWRAKCPPNLLIFWSRGREFWGGRRTHGRKQESVSAGSCLIGGRRTGRRKNRPPNKPWQAQAADNRRALGRFVRPGCRRRRHRTLPQVGADSLRELFNLHPEGQKVVLADKGRLGGPSVRQTCLYSGPGEGNSGVEGGHMAENRRVCPPEAA